jgi:hypothetical protein
MLQVVSPINKNRTPNEFDLCTSFKGGTRWRSWLRQFDSRWWHNPFGRTMTLGSTQPLTEMSTRSILLKGKSGRCVGLTTLPPSCADCLEIWELQPPLQAWNGIALPLRVLKRPARQICRTVVILHTGIPRLTTLRLRHLALTIP